MDKTLLKIQQKNIPVNWRVERFGDVFDFLSTATYSRDILKESGEVQYLHYGDIHTKYNFHLDFTKNSLPFITEIERRNYPYMKNGDLVLADASEDYDGVGKGVEIKNLNDLRAIAGLHTFLLRDKDSNFVLGYKGFVPSCDVVREQFYRFATGTKVYSLSKESLSKVKVLIPPKEEQKAIADCLSTWDDAIEKQTKLIAAKEQRKKALMQQLLSGKKRLPGFTEAWKEVSIKEISSKKSSILQSNALVENSGSYKIYGATGVLTFVDFYEEENRYIGIVKDGSGVGNLFLCDGKSSVIATLDKILPKKNIDLDFLYQLFQTLHFGKYIVGGAIPHIYFRDYSNIHVNLPPELEQRAIGEFLKNVDLELNLLRTKLMFLKKQKVALMQQLLTAKVRLVS